MSAAATTTALCSHCLLPIRGYGHERRVQGEDHRFCCYGCCLAFQVGRGEGEESEAAWLLIRLGVGAFLAMNIMLFSLLLYSGSFEQADVQVRQVVHLILWALATPVLLILGWPLFRETWRAAADRCLTSATLISLGAATAYAYSALAVLTSGAEVYFDTATMLLVLFTLGRYLEASGRARAMRDIAPMLAPEREGVTVVDGGAEVRLRVREVIAGALVLVRPGERDRGGWRRGRGIVPCRRGGDHGGKPAGRESARLHCPRRQHQSRGRPPDPHDRRRHRNPLGADRPLGAAGAGSAERRAASGGPDRRRIRTHGPGPCRCHGLFLGALDIVWRGSARRPRRAGRRLPVRAGAGGRPGDHAGHRAAGAAGLPSFAVARFWRRSLACARSPSTRPGRSRPERPT